MHWEQRRQHRYLYHSRRKGRRVVREYVGSGKAAEAMMAAFEQESLDQVRRREAERLEAERWDKVEAVMAELETWLNLLATATLLVAGFHRHDRGKWRKRRVERTGTNENG